MVVDSRRRLDGVRGHIIQVPGASRRGSIFKGLQLSHRARDHAPVTPKLPILCGNVRSFGEKKSTNVLLLASRAPLLAASRTGDLLRHCRGVLGAGVDWLCFFSWAYSVVCVCVLLVSLGSDSSVVSACLFGSVCRGCGQPAALVSAYPPRPDISHSIGPFAICDMVSGQTSRYSARFSFRELHNLDCAAGWNGWDIAASFVPEGNCWRGAIGFKAATRIMRNDDSPNRRKCRENIPGAAKAGGCLVSPRWGSVARGHVSYFGLARQRAGT